MTQAEPLVSVVVLADGRTDALARLLASIGRQTWKTIETVVILKGAAGGESRHPSSRQEAVRFIEATGSLSLDEVIRRETHGDWIAVVEATDILNPARFSALIPAASEAGAQVALDDCILVGTGAGRRPTTLLRPGAEAGTYRSDQLSARSRLWAAAGAPPVRPVFRRELIGQLGPSFSAEAAGGAHFDLLLKLLANGATCAVVPELTCIQEAGDPRDRAAAGRNGSSPQPGPSPRSLYVLSRQRVVGSTNGSSTYLLGLCKALQAAGFSLHFVSPSPAVFGRWPYLALGEEMRIFSTIRIRGGIRLGRFVVATDPRRALAALLTVVERLLVRARVTRGGWVAPAPYSIGEKWTRDDQLFLVRHAPERASGVLADYAFLTPGIPYLLQPEARSAVVMHDLFSSRGTQFDAIGRKDSVAALDARSEMELLDKADAVVAIQSTEGAFVQKNLPHKTVIVAPMAIEPVASHQPGKPGQVLFVGSSNAPNIDGIQWFIDEIWPRIRAQAPGTVLKVAGSVCSSVRSPPGDVHLLGFVDDLGALYRDAAVVVSPLRTGSGLKVKLVEALGYGKAVVATPATLQGVEEAVSGAVPVTDEASRFADLVLELLHDESLRASRSAAALEVAERHFSAAACYTGLVEFFASPEARPGRP